MRRLLTSVAAVCFLASILGCRHTAGQCDCDGCCGAAPIGPIAPTPLKPEPAQMPKADAPNGAANKPAELPADNAKDNKENKDN